MLLDRWIAPPDDASVPTRVRVDRHVLGGAKVLGWVLAVSLLGLHLPIVLFAYETVSLPVALILGLSGLSALVAVRSLGKSAREDAGDRLSAVVLFAGAASLIASSLVDTQSIERHVLLASIPVTLLSVAAIAPMRPLRMFLAGLLVLGVQLAVAVSGLAGGDHSFHVFALSITFNTVLSSTLITRVRRVGLETLFAREAELRATSARSGELVDTLRRAQSQLVAGERVAMLDRLGAGLAHELKSPLAAVSNGLLELRTLAQELHQSAGHPDVRAEDLRALSADMTQAIRVAEHAQQRVSLQLDGVVERTRDPLPRSRRSFVPLREIETVVELYDHQSRRLGAPLEVSGDLSVSVEGDRSAFAQVVSHLLDRSLRVSAASEKPLVRITLHRDGGDAVLTVTDSGAPLTRIEHQRLFRPVVDAQEGVALFVTRDVVEETFGGRLCVESGPDGNTFEVRIPMHGTDRPPRSTVVSERAPKRARKR